MATELLDDKSHVFNSVNNGRISHSPEMSPEETDMPPTSQTFSDYSSFINLNEGLLQKGFGPVAVKPEKMDFPSSVDSGNMGMISSHSGSPEQHDHEHGSMVVRTRRRKAGLSEDERVCVVCGEPASGYNFDRLTCESCKAFFRRNALKSRDKIKPCARGGGCDVNGSQRKHCPTCRLSKCLQVGMKKELILPPEKLEQRAKPKKRNRISGLSQQSMQQSMSVNQSMLAPKRSMNNNPGLSGVDLDPLLNNDSGMQQHINSMGNEGFSSSAMTDLGPSLIDIAQNWSRVTPIGQKWDCNLNDNDRSTLTQLSEALQRVKEALDPVSGNADATDGIGRLEHAFNQMDACIRRIISVVKLIPRFSEVDKDAQIFMLKVNIYGLVILYSSFFYNPNTGAWEMPVSQASGCRNISLMQELASSVASIIELRPDVSELTAGDLEQYRANADNVYVQLETLSHGDDFVKMLMLALKLFNSDTMPSGICEQIDQAQSCYSLLLKKYLGFKFGVSEAMNLYPRLMLIFIDMRTVEIKMTEFAKLLSVESLNPLVREVTQEN